MRKYKSGSRWAFWRWTLTPSGYITRLHILLTPLGALVVHFINKPDAEPFLHDHPVTFLSIILRGGYMELRRRQGDIPYGFIERRRWFNFIRANREDRHKIVWVAPGTVTLCFMGPKRQEWGFYTPDGWVYWKEYNDARYR